ncbi:MAG: PTS sugar transporter subunit IIA [Candidatus Omnitrophota bacterium]
MQLKIKDLTEAFQIAEKTLLEWIREKNLPAYKINHQYYFNVTEVKEWVLKNNIPVSPRFLEISSDAPLTFPLLLKRGGIFFDIEGKTPIEVIKHAVNRMPIPPEVGKDMVTYSLLEREEMMPTAIGKGIAIPHPRNPIIADTDHESVTLCLLKEPVDFNAADHQPVIAMFIILSANSRRHLQILSRVSYLCRQEDIITHIRLKHPADIIFSSIHEKENPPTSSKP